MVSSSIDTRSRELGRRQNSEPEPAGLHFLVSCYLLIVLIRPHEWEMFSTEFPILAVLQVLSLLAWLGSKPRLDAPQYWTIFALSLAMMLSLLKVSGQFALTNLIDFLTIVGFTFIFIAHASSKVHIQRRFMLIFIFATSIMSIHSVGQMMDPDKIGFSGQEATYRTDSGKPEWQATYIGIFGDPNDLGMVLVMAIPFIFYWRTQKTSGLSRLIVNLTLVLHLVAIYLTNSRGTIVALLAVLAAWLTLRYSSFKMAIFGIVALPVLLLIAPSRFSVTGDASTDTRIDAWYSGLQMFQSYPLFGVGKGQFLEYHHLTAHNSWVIVLAELGSIGYLCWIVLLFTTGFLGFDFVRQKRMSKELIDPQAAQMLDVSKAVFYSFAGGLTAMFFLSRAYQLPIYLISAMVAGQYHFLHDRVQYRMPNLTVPLAVLSGVFSIVVVYVVVRLMSNR